MAPRKCHVTSPSNKRRACFEAGMATLPPVGITVVVLLCRVGSVVNIVVVIIIITPVISLGAAFGW